MTLYHFYPKKQEKKGTNAFCTLPKTSCCFDSDNDCFDLFGNMGQGIMETLKQHIKLRVHFSDDTHAFGGIGIRIIPHGAKRCCNGLIYAVNTIYSILSDKVNLNILQFWHRLPLNVPLLDWSWQLVT